MKYLFKILVILVILLSCQNDFENRKNKKIIEMSVEMADSIVINQSEQGKVTWRLFADTMKNITDKEILHFYSIKLIIFGSISDTSSIIYADSAMIDEANNIITGKGNIRIYTDKGNLFGSSLYWDRNKGKIYSEDSVKVYRKGNIITGERFFSDEQFSHVTLHKATGEGEVSEKKEIW